MESNVGRAINVAVISFRFHSVDGIRGRDSQNLTPRTFSEYMLRHNEIPARIKCHRTRKRNEKKKI